MNLSASLAASLASPSSAAKKPVVIAGDGWAALGVVGFLVKAGVEVRWIAGDRTRILSPLASVEVGSAAQTWKALAELYGVEVGALQEGSFLREFKNKAFREPVFANAAGSESEATDRREKARESLWAPEARLVNLFDARFELTLGEIEEEVRKHLVSVEHPNLRRIEGNSLAGIAVQADSGRLRAVTLASGEEIECETLVYADAWAHLPTIQNLPKGLPFARKREPMGLLQATFTHAQPIGVGVAESFFGVLQRESGEEFERHVWGYFSSDGMRSNWTVCLEPAAAEDNHQIAKKLRRMKQTLEKMFAGSAWLADPEGGFMKQVRDEQVRFEESVIFSEGEPPTEKIALPGVEGVHFLTDGYGPSSAFEQLHFLMDHGRADAQAKNLDRGAAAEL